MSVVFVVIHKDMDAFVYLGQSVDFTLRKSVDLTLPKFVDAKLPITISVGIAEATGWVMANDFYKKSIAA